MNQSLLVPIIDTAQAAARALIGALDVLKAHLAPPVDQPCQHPEQSRQDLSTMGNKRWQCKLCGFIHEEQLSS